MGNSGHWGRDPSRWSRPASCIPSNPGTVPARFLNIYQPAGNEHYLKEVGRHVAAGQPPTTEEMAEIASRYDFVLV